MSDGPAAPDTGTEVVTTQDLPAAQPDTGDVDLAAEVEKWKGLSRKHEAKAKENADAAKQLDELRAQSMTDTEKAIAEARAAADRDAAVRYGARLVDAEVRAAAAGRPIDVAALLEGLDRSRFLDDDGEPDVKAIGAWVDRIAPAAETPSPARVDLGQGARGNGAVALNDPLLKDLMSKVGGPRQ